MSIAVFLLALASPCSAQTSPSIISQPTNRTPVIGSDVTFSVTASGTNPLSYQWRRNGVNVSGGTAATLVIANVQSGHAGTYTCVVTNVAGSVTSNPATLTLNTTPRLVNVSIRALAGGGEDTLIVGFWIAGTGAKTLLIRGLGPELLKRNVTNVVADPQLTLYSGSTAIFSNDNADPTLAADFERVGATVLDADAKDAALKVTLQPGGYTVHLINPGPVAEALVELFDLSRDSGTRFVNLSSRLRINPGETAILGSILIGSTGSVLARNNGPALGELPIDPPILNFLPDPFLRVFPFSGGTPIDENDDWDISLEPRFAAAGASAWTAGSKDAAVRVTVAPGGYTFHATGTGAGGVALIELFASP